MLKSLNKELNKKPDLLNIVKELKLELTKDKAPIEVIEKEVGKIEEKGKLFHLIKKITDKFDVLYKKVEEIRNTSPEFLKDTNFDGVYKKFENLYDKRKEDIEFLEIDSEASKSFKEELLDEYFSNFFCIYAQQKFEEELNKENSSYKNFLPKEFSDMLNKFEEVKKAMVDFLEKIDYEPLKIELGKAPDSNYCISSPPKEKENRRFANYGTNTIISVSKWGYRQLSTGEISKAKVDVTD